MSWNQDYDRSAEISYGSQLLSRVHDASENNDGFERAKSDAADKGAKSFAEPDSEPEALEDVEEFERAMNAAVNEFIDDADKDRVVARRCGVWILVAKGNLRHRLLKLGVELPPEQQTEDQQELSDIAHACACGGKPGRATWSNGACIFLSKEHLRAIQWDVDEKRDKALNVVLQSKHIVCSACFYNLIQRVLEQQPERANQYITACGRERFHIKRSGEIQTRDFVELP